MAKAAPPPRWAQRNQAYAAQSRGEDGSQHIQTMSGGVPGRIRGVSPLQQMASMKAYRSNGLDAHYARQYGQQQPAAAPAPVAATAAPVAFPQEPPTYEQLRANRRKNMILGGAQPNQADAALAQEGAANASKVAGLLPMAGSMAGQPKPAAPAMAATGQRLTLPAITPLTKMAEMLNRALMKNKQPAAPARSSRVNWSNTYNPAFSSTQKNVAAQLKKSPRVGSAA